MMKVSKDFSKVLNLYLIDEIHSFLLNLLILINDTDLMNIQNNNEFDSYILNYKQIANDERYQKLSLRY